MTDRIATLAARIVWSLFALAALAIGLAVTALPLRAPASAEAARPVPAAAIPPVAAPAPKPADGPFVVRSILPIAGHKGTRWTGGRSAVNRVNDRG